MKYAIIKRIFYFEKINKLFYQNGALQQLKKINFQAKKLEYEKQKQRVLRVKTCPSTPP
jgi:hypothetical protein